MESIPWLWILGTAAVIGLVRVAFAVWRRAQSLSHRLHAIAAALEPFAQRSASPRDVARHELFEEGVSLLVTSPRIETTDVEAYARGENWIITALALEALARRQEKVALIEIISSLGQMPPWSSWFLFQGLLRVVPAEEPVLGRVISQINESWSWNQPLQRYFADFVRARQQTGDDLAAADGFDVDAESQSEVENVLRRLGSDLGGPLLAAFVEWKRGQVDLAFLQRIGRLRPKPSTPPLAHDEYLRALARLDQAISSGSSAVVLGDSGVGKSCLIEGMTARLAERGYRVFEAGGPELVAGQIYRGQFEERLKSVVEQLSGVRVVWYVPDLSALRASGRSVETRWDALDFLLPALERREITLITECLPTAWERLVEEKPRLRRALVRVPLAPLSEQQTRELARSWAERTTADPELPLRVDERVLAEAASLAQQFLSDRAAPGNLLQLLDATHDRLSAIAALEHHQNGAGEAVTAADPTASASRSQSPVELGIDDLVVTLEQLTGLPAAILDDRRHLDLADLAAEFERSILGQEAAIRTLVERIAMIKAGVCDPTRPLGVFLFAGPTGTGKTELVKKLAEYLFGSAERMVRLDMSELQTPDSLARLLGYAEQDTGTVSLVDQVRKQPFTVVLLDEFEKAAAAIWDLFLQVFDDGRLTDRRGQVTDFRNTLLILTSNLGAAIPTGSAIGFGDGSGAFSPATVERQIRSAFRPELLNRIDRIVIFRPFSRQVMRQILEREVRKAFERRGLRRREWAVEWDSSATDFLLERGFTPDLGARPLKRAVEQYLLSPLAKVIVDGRVPQGEQFLFVRAGRDRLVVDFVDADEPEPATETAAGTSAETLPDRELVIQELILSPRGNDREAVFLGERSGRLRRRLDHPDWEARKQRSYERMSETGFWADSGRFRTLAEIDALDRIASALRTIEGLERRLQRQCDDPPSGLVSRLAHKVWLLERAVRDLEREVPWDAYLTLDPGPTASPDAKAFLGELVAMYEAWAEKRGMRLESHSAATANSHRFAAGVLTAIAASGFCAWSLLAGEAGVHVFERPRDRGGFSKLSVRVRVAPQPLDPQPGTPLEQALEATEGAGSELGIVRRYRREPSPLVRDSVRDFKTGRIERVLGGDFDLLGDRDRESVVEPAS